MLAIVMLDTRESTMGTVVEVTDDPIQEIRDRYADRDGAIPEKLRIWRSFPGCKVGDRVGLPA